MTVWIMLIQIFRSGLAVVPGHYESAEACWNAANQATFSIVGDVYPLAKQTGVACIPVQKETLR